jgi:hypothetical protein
MRHSRLRLGYARDRPRIREGRTRVGAVLLQHCVDEVRPHLRAGGGVGYMVGAARGAAAHVELLQIFLGEFS